MPYGCTCLFFWHHNRFTSGDGTFPAVYAIGPFTNSDVKFLVPPDVIVFGSKETSSHASDSTGLTALFSRRRCPCCLDFAVPDINAGDCDYQCA